MYSSLLKIVWFLHSTIFIDNHLLRQVKEQVDNKPILNTAIKMIKLKTGFLKKNQKLLV